MKATKSGIVIGLVLVLLVPGSVVGQATSASSDKESQRVEADFFSLTFPDGWAE